MHRIRLTAIALASSVAAACLGGCATPGSTTSQAAAAPDCGQVATEVARAEAARQAALERQRGAWKAVIPFAVAGTVVAARRAEDDAERRIGELKREAALRGCVPADA